MELMYFTNAESLRDEDLRAQCLRLPEVLGEIRRLQSREPGLDLLSTVPFDSEFAAFSDELKKRVFHSIQEGIAERFFARGGKVDAVLRRKDFLGAAAVAKDLRWRLGETPDLRVHVVGPGFDEVPRLARDERTQFIDVLAEDPALEWFWTELKKAASS